MFLTDESYPVLNLEELEQRVVVLTKQAADFYRENALVCLSNQQHSTGCPILARFNDESYQFVLRWAGEVDAHMKRCYRDLVQATEYAACAIGLLLVENLTEFVGVEQAVRGSTVDYYLAYKDDDDDLPFNHAARLEVTGILAETEHNTIQKRINAKKRRHEPEQDLPTLVAVVEFGEPKAVLEEI